ncbi:FG-GAP-like repeat-containing protein [Granulicella cerasi]|uniref:FG-GAP-like repeat-containing protein n=1 Tax=Granulicella cerasi TaxID=741063 RepID=A0ABW1Z5S8_9BACT|nr:FG-GAP-like repeat-containing protein [Granulicella cerasi]
MLRSLLRPAASLYLFLLFAAASAGLAQTFRSAVVQEVSGTPTNLATADFNKDGHPDIVYQDAHTGGSLHVMQNNGSGTFTEVQQIAVLAGIGGKITAADVNNDGFPDLIVAYDGYDTLTIPPEFNVFLNNGNGTFGTAIASTYPITSGPDDPYYHLAVADFDKDGHMDFVFTSTGCGVCVMRGDGNGHFQPYVSSGAAFDADVFVGDFNEDGRPDFVVRNLFEVDLFLNQGSSFQQIKISPFLYQQQGLYVADINHDGHLDILYGSNYSLQAAMGLGDGTFVTNTVGALVAPILSVADTNGDGLADIISSSDIGPIAMIQNTSGKFSYTSLQGVAGGDKGLLSPVYADFDGDGLGDIITGATGALITMKGVANGTFAGATSFYTQSDALDVQITDFNRDGNPDVEVTAGGGSYYGSLYAFTGDGQGNFAESGQMSSGGLTYSGQSSIADFNGDGLPDVFNTGYIVYGSGTLGTFAQTPKQIAPLPTGNHPSGYSTVADFNEDGYPDALYSTASGGYGGGNYLVLAVSTGLNAYSSTILNVPATPLAVVAKDINHDGHVDLVVASTTQVFVYLGDGKGNLTLAQTLELGFSTMPSNGAYGPFADLEVADVDGDGNLDLLVPIQTMPLIRIFYGKADGTFEAPVSLTTQYPVGFVTVADIDLDGRQDLVLGGHGLVRILHGLGSRTFGAPQSLAGNSSPQKIRVADVNHDGNPDLIVPNGGINTFLDPGQSFTVLVNATAPAAPASSTTLTCLPSRINIGDTAQLTALVTASSGTPTGSITFTDNGATLSTLALANGSASIGYLGAVAGVHSLVASFTPTNNFSPSNASCQETVVGLPTTASLTATPTALQYGSPVTLTATVAATNAPGPSVPTGTVTFYSNGALLGSATLNNGVASLAASSLGVGVDNLTCSYGGNAIYLASNCNTVPATVDAAASSLTLTSSNNPAPALTPVTFTAQLSINGQHAAAGTVIALSINGQTINLTTDGTGSAKYTTTTLTSGTYPVTATTVATSTTQSSSAALSEVITANATATNLTIVPNPAYMSQLVTMTATVASPQAGVPTPVGSILFTDGTTTLSTQPLNSAGVATFSTSTLAVGTHPITASYVPAITSYASSTSTVVNEVILPSDFMITLSSASITLAPGSTGTVTVQLASVGNFAGPLTLTLGALPAYATASLKPTSVTLTAGSTATSTLTINTAMKAGNALPEKPGSKDLPLLFCGFFLLGLPVLAKSARKPVRLLLSLLLMMALQSTVGCTHSYYTLTTVSTGSYQLPVTATDANHNPKTAILTVIVK